MGNPASVDSVGFLSTVSRATATGIRTMNVDPSSTTLENRIVPPILSINCLAMCSPSPVLLASFGVMSERCCRKILARSSANVNTNCRSKSLMPQPVSFTAISMRSVSTAVTKISTLPFCVALIALEIKLLSTRFSLNRSVVSLPVHHVVTTSLTERRCAISW